VTARAAAGSAGSSRRQRGQAAAGSVGISNFSLTQKPLSRNPLSRPLRSQLSAIHRPQTTVSAVKMAPPLPLPTFDARFRQQQEAMERALLQTGHRVAQLRREWAASGGAEAAALALAREQLVLDELAERYAAHVYGGDKVHRRCAAVVPRARAEAYDRA